MPYQWIAFYDDHQFLREVPAGAPPHELIDPRGGAAGRLTSIQLYDHRGRAFIEQTFTDDRRPILATIRVPHPTRHGTVPCHVLGWQQTVYGRSRDGRERPVNVRHLAHCVEDGRVVMTPGPADEALFRRRPRRNPGRPHAWAAIYDRPDGDAVLHQFDPATGREHSGEQVDRTRLVAMTLADGAGRPFLEQHYAPGMRLIYRRRVEQRVPALRPAVAHLLGWQRAVGGVNCQHVSYLFEESGAVIMVGPFDESHGWFYPPEPVPGDARPVGGPAPPTATVLVGAGC
jgi:hypothetical protein